MWAMGALTACGTFYGDKVVILNTYALTKVIKSYKLK